MNILARCSFFLLLCCLAACVPGQKIGHDRTIPATVRARIYKGTIVRKSNRPQTLVIKTSNDDQVKEITVHIDFRTRGLEYAVKGKEVRITCRDSTPQNSTAKKICTAGSIEPGETVYAPGVETITVAQLKKKIDAHRDFLLIDAGPADEYLGHHLPGARSIPACASGSDKVLAGIDRNETLILYCGWPDCDQSIALAKKAVQKGFTEIRILAGGRQAWVAKGYPLVAEDGFILSGKPVLLDLRTPKEDSIRRIQGSISMPLEQLNKKIRKIPAEAPIVIYSDHRADSLLGLKKIREAGFSGVAMIKGGLRGWIKRGNRVVSGPVQTSVQWRRRPGVNEVSADRFRAAQQGKIRATILDVRTDKERNTLGVLKNSVHIPLFSLFTRLDELDKKRTIYCAAGPRAETAVRELRKKGYSAYYLQGPLSCAQHQCRPQQ